MHSEEGPLGGDLGGSWGEGSQDGTGGFTRRCRETWASTLTLSYHVMSFIVWWLSISPNTNRHRYHSWTSQPPELLAQLASIPLLSLWYSYTAKENEWRQSLSLKRQKASQPAKVRKTFIIGEAEPWVTHLLGPVNFHFLQGTVGCGHSKRSP